MPSDPRHLFAIDPDPDPDDYDEDDEEEDEDEDDQDEDDEENGEKWYVRPGWHECTRPQARA